MAGGPVAPPPSVYTYGAAGARDNLPARVSERDDAWGRTTLAYDSLGETSVRVFSPMDPSTGLLMMSGGGTVRYRMQTTYDRLGRLARIVYPDLEDLRYGYDGGGAVTSARSDRREYLTRITYHELGQRTQVTYGNGAVSNYAYTSTLHGRDTLNTLGPIATNIQNVRSAYANNGDITDISDGPEDRLVGGNPGVVKQHYEDDALDRTRMGGVPEPADSFALAAANARSWLSRAGFRLSPSRTIAADGEYIGMSSTPGGTGGHAVHVSVHDGAARVLEQGQTPADAASFFRREMQRGAGQSSFYRVESVPAPPPLAPVSR